MFGVFYFAFPYFADILVETPVPPVGGVLTDISFGIGQKKSFADEAILGGGGSW